MICACASSFLLLCGSVALIQFWHIAFEHGIERFCVWIVFLFCLVWRHVQV